jgi:hypothetical protein
LNGWVVGEGCRDKLRRVFCYHVCNLPGRSTGASQMILA